MCFCTVTLSDCVRRRRPAAFTVSSFLQALGSENVQCQSRRVVVLVERVEYLVLAFRKFRLDRLVTQLHQLLNTRSTA